MLRALRTTRLLDILREVDLGALQREAEGRFHLLIRGEAPLAAALAGALSTTLGQTGVHPWISQGDPGEASLYPPDLVLLVTEAKPPADLLTSASRQRVPVVVVRMVGEAPPEVGADLPMPGEAARVTLRVDEAAELPELVQKELVPALLRALPARLHLALARQLPLVRPVVMRTLIEETARANALYAASTGVAELVPVLNLPLNVADTLVLSKNQGVMVYKLALAAGKTGGAREILTEAVGVLGGGLLFRQVARGLVGLVPVWGLLPKVAVAYAGTWVIGQAAELWATQGKTPRAGELRSFYAEALERGRAFARSLTEGRPRFLGRGRSEALPRSDEEKELGE